MRHPIQLLSQLLYILEDACFVSNHTKARVLVAQGIPTALSCPDRVPNEQSGGRLHPDPCHMGPAAVCVHFHSGPTPNQHPMHHVTLALAAEAPTLASNPIATCTVCTASPHSSYTHPAQRPYPHPTPSPAATPAISTAPANEDKG